MREYYISLAIVLLMSVAGPARADGLIYKLPKDGTWATYLLESASSVEGKVLESVKTTVRIASIGEVTENGIACRWIEIVAQAKKESEDDGPEGKTRVRVYDERVHKLLIAEKHLTKGEAPLNHVIRGWMRRGKRNPQKIEGPGASLRSLASLLYGPLKDAKALPKAEVESKKLGKLLCEGVTGSLNIENPATGTIRMKLEDRLHPSAPFGLVSSRCVFDVELQRKVGDIKEGIVTTEWTLTLTDYGDNATSEMPDVK